MFWSFHHHLHRSDLTEELGERDALKEEESEREKGSDADAGDEGSSAPALFLEHLDRCVPCRTEDEEEDEGAGPEYRHVWRTAWRARAWASVASVAVFFVYGFFIGLVFWLATDYPFFLFFDKGPASR